VLFSFVVICAPQADNGLNYYHYSKGVPYRYQRDMREGIPEVLTHLYAALSKKNDLIRTYATDKNSDRLFGLWILKFW
jgi:hypothetical protein